MRKSMLTALALLGACSAAQAQDYFDIESIPGLPEQPSVRVDLDAAMLGFAAGAAGVSDPGMADLLRAIEGARVHVYQRLEDATAVTSFVEDASGRLEQDGWNRVFYAEDGDDTVRIFARLEGAIMNGLTVMALTTDEAVFVNIAGRISAEQLGRVVQAMSAAKGRYAGRTAD